MAGRIEYRQESLVVELRNNNDNGRTKMGEKKDIYIRKVNIGRKYVSSERKPTFPDRSNRFAFTTKPTATSRAVPVTHRRRRFEACSPTRALRIPITTDDNPRATAWNHHCPHRITFRGAPSSTGNEGKNRRTRETRGGKGRARRRTRERQKKKKKKPSINKGESRKGREGERK